MSCAKATAPKRVQPPAPNGDVKVNYHTLKDEAEVFRVLATRETGLTTAEVAERTATYGLNVIKPPNKPGFFSKLWDQINNMVIFILLAAIVIAGSFQDWVELGLIAGVVIINVAIGMAQEYKADKAAEAIRKMLSANAVVDRNGKRTTIPSEQLVPGDIVFVQSGDKMPADLRFVQVNNLRVMEAVLTGESEAVHKDTVATAADVPLGDRKCLGFSGTEAVYGQATGVVCATGDYAEIGKISALVESNESMDTPLQTSLNVFGQWLSWITVVIAVSCTFIAIFARGLPVKLGLEVAVGIAVAIIPEGLPAVVTITLAIGVQHMAKKKAIIRQLPAVESLGSVTVICSDKTGTLTKNEMTVTFVQTRVAAYRVTGSGYAPGTGTIKQPQNSEDVSGEELGRLRAVIMPGLIANDSTVSYEGGTSSSKKPIRKDIDGKVEATPTPASQSPDGDWNLTGDPTEGALLTLGMKAGIPDTEAYRKEYPRRGVVPFESEYKFHAIMIDIPRPGGGTVRVVQVKGAYDRVIARCSKQVVGNDVWRTEDCDHDFWLDAAGAYSKEGLRVLAFAHFIVPSTKTTVSVQDILNGPPHMTMNAIVAIVDPPRQESIDAIKVCHMAGITVKMITGDHPDTAKTIGGWVGIVSEETLTGQQVEEMSEEELFTHVIKCNIYARASPEHKLRIVKALQAHGHVCAMTGDGVNDAPALKQAQIGVAMGITGTEVAKEAAKMILADDSFATIAEAVKQGRCVYDNLVKAILFALPTNFAQGFCIVAALVIGMPTPLTAIQVLWVNMVTSVTLGLVLAIELPEADIMDRPPRDPKQALLGPYAIFRTFYVTLAFVVTMLGNFRWEEVSGGSLDQARSVAMTTLVVSQCFYAISCRYILHSGLTLHAWIDNSWMIAANVLNVGLQVLLVYTPGVQQGFNMAAINGIAWARVIGLSIAVFLLVEAEKFFGPRYIAPCLFPILNKMFASCPRRICPCGSGNYFGPKASSPPVLSPEARTELQTTIAHNNTSSRTRGKDSFASDSVARTRFRRAANAVIAANTFASFANRSSGDPPAAVHGHRGSVTAKSNEAQAAKPIDVAEASDITAV